MLGADARSAVGGDGVIPARLVPESVERMDVFKETFARVRWRDRRAVKIDVLLAIVRAHADHVALIGHDINEFKLPVEPADSGISLADGLPCLNRKAKRRGVCKLETDDGMRNPWRTPVIDGEIDTSDLRETHGARLPPRGVVGLGPVVAVADVVQRYFVALNVGPPFLGNVRLPVAIVGRRKGQPPNEHASKKQSNGAYFAPEWPNEYQGNCGCYRQESSHDFVCIAEWSVKPYCTKCPGGGNDGGEEEEQLTDPANDSHHIASSTTSFKIH